MNLEDLSKKRSIDYKDAILIIRKDLEAPPHGYIKKLCKQARLTYNTVIGLINNTIDFVAPVLVLDLLVALGYEVKMTRETVSMGEGKKQYREYTTYLLVKKKGVVAIKDPAESNVTLTDLNGLTPEGRPSKLTIREARNMEDKKDHHLKQELTQQTTMEKKEAEKEKMGSL